MSTAIRVVLAFLVPLAVSFVITGLMIRWATAFGLLDIPNARKVHTRPIPKGGGLGIFFGWLSAALLLDFEELLVWGGIGLCMVVLGLVDDIRPLPWQLRLGFQVIAAISSVSAFGGFPESDWKLVQYLLWPAAVIWIVGLTNAFNMLDNMDALSGGVAWIAAALFGAASIGEARYTFLTAFPTNHYLILTAQLMLMGALTAFLCFNRPPARIFMGDAGSTFLGFFFGTSSLVFAGLFHLSSPILDYGLGLIGGLHTATFIPSQWAPIVCFLAIPWYDLVSVVTIRLCQGRSPFQADKQHLSHRLVALGLSPPRAVGTICLLALVIGVGGLLLNLVPNNGSNLVLIWVIGCWIALAVFEFLTRHKRQIAVDKP